MRPPALLRVDVNQKDRCACALANGSRGAGAGLLDRRQPRDHERHGHAPRFYDTLTTNCTTGAFMHTRVNPDAPAWSRRIRFSGYVPDYLYEVGRLDTARPSPSSSASRS